MPQEIKFIQDFFKEKSPFTILPVEPLSDNLSVDVKTLPVSAVDAPSLPLGSLIIVGFLFCIGIAVYFVPSFSGLVPLEHSGEVSSLSSSFPYFTKVFGALVSTLALLRFCFIIIRHSCRKVFTLGNRYVTVNIANIFGRKTFMEAIANYSAIRYRVRFKANNSLFYVIEMEHKDSLKNIPLYVAKDGVEICKKVMEYAEKFNLPIRFMAEGEEVDSKNTIKAEKKNKISLSHRLKYFSKAMFLGIFIFFVLLDVLLFATPLIKAFSFYGVLLITAISGLLVFLLPLCFCFRTQKITFLKYEMQIKEFVFGGLKVDFKNIKYKDIISAHIIRQDDKNMLIINTQNGALILGYGANLSSLEDFKRQIELRTEFNS